MIIVGTDFSASALLALGEARALAQRLQAAVEVFHVRPLHLEAEWEPNDDERTWLSATRVADFDIEVRRGTPWVELVRAAGERGAQLIVVGTHGHSGFQPLALGSTAQRLALLSPIPTVLVGSRERPAEDGSDWGHRNGAVTHERDGDMPSGQATWPRRTPSKERKTR